MDDDFHWETQGDSRPRKHKKPPTSFQADPMGLEEMSLLTGCDYLVVKFTSEEGLTDVARLLAKYGVELFVIRSDHNLLISMYTRIHCDEVWELASEQIPIKEYSLGAVHRCFLRVFQAAMKTLGVP